MATTATPAAMGTSFSLSPHSFKCTLLPNTKCCLPDVARFLKAGSPSSVARTVWGCQYQARLGISRDVLCTSVAQVGATGAVEEEGESDEIPIGDIVEKLVKADGMPGDTKLYIGNLPYNVDSAELARIVQDYAVPELVEVIYNRDTGRSKGFAFVTMSNVEECNMIIENLDGVQCQGRPLRVNMAAKPRPMLPLYQETEHKLFVGNLSWTVTSETLMSVFQEFGTVVDARVLYDGETGRSRGYGFVCYSKKDDMEAALNQLNGEELEGRAMRVGLADGRKARYDQ